MTLEEEVGEIVIGHIAEQFGKGKEEIKYSTKPIEDLNADILDAIELIMNIETSIEEKYKKLISFPDDYTPKDVREIVRYTTQRIEGHEE